MRKSSDIRNIPSLVLVGVVLFCAEWGLEVILDSYLLLKDQAAAEIRRTLTQLH